ncbi:MAG: CopG family transcriptional regulator [Thermocrispum sp.]
MKKTTIYLDEADEQLVRDAAARRGSSRTDFIREAIREKARHEVAAPRRPQPLGRSGHTDTARRVDEVLGELGYGR